MISALLYSPIEECWGALAITVILVVTLISIKDISKGRCYPLFMSGVTYVEVDVSSTVASGGSLLPRILDVAASLRQNQGLRVIAPFEPAPLYLVLREMGFQHKAHRREDGSWVVLFYK